ncbi:MAG: hypothetical protein ACI9C4_002920 [Paraglaciecola sp.]|jgi:hypothetical protein|tara:strand:- start:5 stop:190 length:186 start_codon:yes stop_codon:yes gene_type:complete
MGKNLGKTNEPRNEGPSRHTRGADGRTEKLMNDLIAFNISSLESIKSKEFVGEAGYVLPLW